MKRILLFFLIFLLCTSIAGCGQKPTVYEKNGYTVDLDAGTITKDGDVYAFTVTGRDDRSRIEITYPNGANYYFQWDETAATAVGAMTTIRNAMRTVIS